MTRGLETLFLDAGGVLMVPNWGRVSATFAAHGVHVSDAALRAAEPAIKFAIDNRIGVATSSDAGRWGDYLGGVLRTAGVPASGATAAALDELRAYHAEHNLWERVPDDVFPALERIRQLDLKIAIASNANGSLHRALDRLGLTSYFDTICDSFLEGVEKPDPAFFRVVLERSNSRPETTVHVGDLYHVDIVGARNTGLRAILLDRDDQYGGFDVERVRNLTELADRLEA
jgi:HAD superfamily hydrolase (TIGR01509 family)